MRVRTTVGLISAAVVMITVGILTYLNAELLRAPFQITPSTAIPFWALLLGVFLASFLPTVSLLLAQSLRRDLEARRQRRRARQEESIRRAYQRGVDLMSDRQWAEARRELETVLEAQPNDFDALLRFGQVLRHLGEADEAAEVHKRGAVLYPQSIALLYELALDYEAAQQRDVAKEVRNRILREFTGMGLRVTRRRRDQALEERRWKDASEHQDRIVQLLGGQLSLDPGEQMVRQGLRYQQGVSCLEEERYSEGAEIFRELLASEPRFIPAAIMLGEALQLQGGEGAREKAVEAWVEGYRQTGSPVFLQRIEDHFIEGTDPATAIETLWALIGEASNDLLPRFFLGRLYYRLEMHPEALKILEGIDERIARSRTYHFLMARIHERREDLQQALQAHLASAQQIGLTTTEYHCSVCRAKYPDWDDRCSRCGSWNSIDLDFEEERLSPAELGVREAPVWGGYAEDPELKDATVDDSGKVAAAATS
ncbi:MAG: tetratricopeptide repeat protein [Acidobacteriota bacterium]